MTGKECAHREPTVEDIVRACENLRDRVEVLEFREGRDAQRERRGASRACASACMSASSSSWDGAYARGDARRGGEG